MPGLRDLVQEIHRRSMWQVLLIYVGGSWVVWEAIEGISSTAGLPDWVPGAALILILIGLPIVVATAFVHERPVAVENEGLVDGIADEVIAVSGEAVSQAAIEKSASGTPGPFNIRNATLVSVSLAAGVFIVMNTGIWPVGGGAEVEVEVAEGRGAASVVVLPFDNIGGREDVSYLSEGITEQITAQLAKVPELKVISRTSSQTVAGYNLTIPEIADSLGVEHVVEGSVQLFEDQIRVTAQLIHAETDEHLWADSYDGRLQDLFALQEDIAIQVASALTSAVGGVREISSGSRTEEPVAYEAYLIGKSQLHSRSTADMLAAIESFERSIAQDPGYAPAYAGLAMAHSLLIGYGHPELNGYELYGRAMAMANRAIELDVNFGEAYAARGYLTTRALGPAEPIEADFQRALELSPNSADAHGWYSHFLVRERRYDEAAEEAGKSIDIDPLHPGKRYGAALDAIGANRYDVVVQESQRAVGLEPTLTVPYFLLGLANLLEGRPDECLSVLGDLSPGVRAMCHHSRGDESQAMQLVDSLKGTLSSTDTPVNNAEMILYRDIAMFYAWIGELDQALDWLERAVSWSHNAVEFRILGSGIFERALQDQSFRSGLERIQALARQRLLQASG